jgi:aryl-alcohol dehydrogenase-like predicted oxidoreductase
MDQSWISGLEYAPLESQGHLKQNLAALKIELTDAEFEALR